MLPESSLIEAVLLARVGETSISGEPPAQLEGLVTLVDDALYSEVDDVKDRYPLEIVIAGQ